MDRRSFLELGLASGFGAAAFAASSRYKAAITSNTQGGWENDVWLSFREAKAAGYNHVESFIHYFTDYWDRPRDLQKRLDDIGLKFVTISNGAPMETHFEDPSKHDKLIADHMRLIRLIKALGCDHLKINMGGRRETGTTQDDLKHMASALNRLGPMISAEGLKFGVHAHMWSQFENRSEIDFIMSHTDPKHVWFVLDTGHITMAGIDPVDLAKTLGHRVIEFHMKDVRPENRGGAKARLERPDMMKDPPFFELGHGGVDFVGLKKHLDSIAWSGFLTVELDSSPFIGPKKSAMKSREYLRRVYKV